MSAQSCPPLALEQSSCEQPSGSRTVWSYLEKPVTGVLLTIALSIMAAQLQDPSTAASFAFEQIPGNQVSANQVSANQVSVNQVSVNQSPAN